MTGEGIEEVGCITVVVLGFREQTVWRGATTVTRCLALLPPCPHHVTVPLWWSTFASSMGHLCLLDIQSLESYLSAYAKSTSSPLRIESICAQIRDDRKSTWYQNFKRIKQNEDWHLGVFVSWKPKTRACKDRDLGQGISVEQIWNSFSQGHQNPAGCST
jgi:hypothetical protein